MSIHFHPGVKLSLKDIYYYILENSTDFHDRQVQFVHTAASAISRVFRNLVFIENQPLRSHGILVQRVSHLVTEFHFATKLSVSVIYGRMTCTYLQSDEIIQSEVL